MDIGFIKQVFEKGFRSDVIFVLDMLESQGLEEIKSIDKDKVLIQYFFIDEILVPDGMRGMWGVLRKYTIGSIYRSMLIYIISDIVINPFNYPQLYKHLRS